MKTITKTEILRALKDIEEGFEYIELTDKPSVQAEVVTRYPVLYFRPYSELRQVFGPANVSVKSDPYWYYDPQTGSSFKTSDRFVVKVEITPETPVTWGETEAPESANYDI